MWLCLQSSSTNCVYMYFVIPRYLAIREAQAATCHAAALHPHPPRTHTRSAPALHPLCTRAAPLLRPTHCAPPTAHLTAPHGTSRASALLPTQAYDAAAFDRWGEVLAARAVLLASIC